MIPVQERYFFKNTHKEQHIVREWAERVRYSPKYCTSWWLTILNSNAAWLSLQVLVQVPVLGLQLPVPILSKTRLFVIAIKLDNSSSCRICMSSCLRLLAEHDITQSCGGRVTVQRRIFVSNCTWCVLSSSLLINGYMIWYDMIWKANATNCTVSCSLISISSIDGFNVCLLWNRIGLFLSRCGWLRTKRA